VKEHLHSVNAAVTGLSALPATAKPMAAVKAMSRFLNHENLTRTALIEPLQEAIREAVAGSSASVVHDWCMFSFHSNTRKHDCVQRTHGQDVGSPGRVEWLLLTNVPATQSGISNTTPARRRSA